MSLRVGGWRTPSLVLGTVACTSLRLCGFGVSDENFQHRLATLTLIAFAVLEVSGAAQTPPPTTPAIIRIKDHGAVGDGVTPDDVAFNKALAAALEIKGPATLEFEAKGGALNWDTKLRQRLPWLAESPATSLTFRTSGIWQAMLAAWAKHEHTAMFTTAALEWFEGGMKSDFNVLAKQYAFTKPTTP